MRRRIHIRISLEMIAGLAIGVAIGYLAFHAWPMLAHAFNRTVEGLTALRR